MRGSTSEQILLTIQTIEIVACKNLQAVIGFIDSQNFFVAIAIEIESELIDEAIASAVVEYDISRSCISITKAAHRGGKVLVAIVVEVGKGQNASIPMPSEILGFGERPIAFTKPNG